MMKSPRARFEAAYDRVLRLREQPEHLVSAGFAALYDSPEYQEVIALGLDALPFFLERIEAGDLFANEVVLRITGLDATSLTGIDFPSEQEVRAALVKHLRAATPHKI